MYKNAARYVSLSVAGMIGVSVYILADTFFISLGFGADGLAVLNMTLPIYGLIYAIGAMLGLGFAVDYSIRKAQKLKTDTIFMEAIFWSILISIPFVLIGIFSPDGILRLLGADAELAQMGKEYTRLILCGSPLFMCNYSFMSFCRNDNAPSYAMIGSIAGSMYNIVFDYVFMFVAGLGFTGAALATVGCPVVTMLFCTAHFRSGKNGVPFRIGKPSLRHLLRCSSVGMSGFIGDFANGVTTAVFNFVMLGLAGNVAVAAYGVIANIALVCISVNNGIAQGMQPLISKTFGKGEKENVAKLLKFGMIVMAATSVAFVLVSFVFAKPLISIFNSEGNAELLAYAIPGIRKYFIGFLFAGINVMIIAYYSAIAEPKFVVIGSLLRGLILIVGFTPILAALLGMGGVWYSFAAAEIVTFVIILLLRRKKTRGIGEAVDVVE